MAKTKYLWGSEKRKKENRNFALIGLFTFLGMLIISKINIAIALLLLWFSLMSFIFALSERLKDQLDKLEKKYGK